MIDLRMLGVFEVRISPPNGAQGALTQPKRLALLVYLALAEPAGLHSRDRLMGLLWPDADDGSSRHSLRNALYAIRQTLGDGVIVTLGETYVGLEVGAFRCDALELRAHLAAGRTDDALACWTGELLPGFHVSGAPEFERWLDEQRTQLRQSIQTAAWRRARELEGTSSELTALRRATRLDRGDEPGARRLMRLLAGAGDRGGALRAYQELADYLLHELEAEPSAETRALATELRLREAGAHSARVKSVSAERSSVPSVPVDVHVSNPPSRRDRRSVPVAIATTGAVALLALGTASYFAHRPAPTSSAQAEAERAVLRLPARYRADTAAYGSYLRGLTLRFQLRFEASRDTFASLVNRNPTYVPALYGLAHTYAFAALNHLSDPDEAWPKVDALARRALALDSTAASAWLALASEDMFARLDLPSAGERITRASTLDSLDPDVPGMRSVWFRFHGQMDSAVAEARRAHRLDPLSPLFGRLVGKQLYFARRYEEARLVFVRMLKDDPAWMRGYEDVAEVDRASGHPSDVVAWLRRMREVAGDSAGVAAFPVVTTDAAAESLLAADARRTIARLDHSVHAGERVPPSRYASTYAVLGDTLATLRWLDSIVVHHDSYVHHVRIEPRFDFLRSHPRYRAWEARSGLPPLATRTGDRRSLH